MIEKIKALREIVMGRSTYSEKNQAFNVVMSEARMLEEALRQKDSDLADAMSLVLQHEGRIARLNGMITRAHEKIASYENTLCIEGAKLVAMQNGDAMKAIDPDRLGWLYGYKNLVGSLKDMARAVTEGTNPDEFTQGQLLVCEEILHLINEEERRHV